MRAWAAECGGLLDDLATDLGLAALHLAPHLRVLQCGLVLRGLHQADRRRRVKAVAVAEPAAGETKARQRHHGIAEQREQPLHRAHEGFLAAAPAHALGHQFVHALERLLEDRGDQLGGGFARLGLAVVQLAVLLAERRELDATLLGEAERGRGRLAVLERDVQCRACELHRLRGLLVGDPGDQHRDATRSGVELCLSVADAAARQSADGAGAQRLGERHHVAGGQILAAKFDQQVAGHGAAIGGCERARSVRNRAGFRQWRPRPAGVRGAAYRRGRKNQFLELGPRF